MFDLNRPSACYSGEAEACTRDRQQPRQSSWDSCPRHQLGDREGQTVPWENGLEHKTTTTYHR